MNRSQRVLALASLALVGFTSSAAFGNVLTVAPSGAQHNQIQNAVFAAASGDVIMISPGTYGAVSIFGKSLTLCSKVSGSVTITGTTTVSNLTSSQRVILSGLRGVGPFTSQFGGDTGAGLVITNNAGSVRVESCTFIGANGWGDNTVPVYPSSCCEILPEGTGRAGAVVRDNSQGVSFIACEFQGGRGAIPNTNPYMCYCGSSRGGGDGLRVQSTLVSLYDSNCFGGRGGDSPTSGGVGGAGCRLFAGATVTGAFASGARFQGGRGGDAWDFLGNIQPGAGGPGLQVGAGTLVHLLDNTYFGGAGGISYYFAPGAPGVPLGGLGSIFHDPESRIVMTTDRSARAKSIVDVVIQGTPGQDVHLIVSRTPTFQILPSWRGTLLSLPGKGSVEIPLGSIPASGVLLSRYTVPSLPLGVPSLTVFVQAFRFDPVLGPKLAAGTSLTLLP